MSEEILIGPRKLTRFERARIIGARALQVSPKSEYVARAAQLALTQASAETIEPLLKAAAPTLMALASSGEKIAELEGDIYEDEELEDEDEVEDAEYEEQEPIDVTPAESEVGRSGPRGVPTSQAAGRHRR